MRPLCAPFVPFVPDDGTARVLPMEPKADEPTVIEKLDDQTI
jgi:hypothetical protein